jgi:hypothetical protein
VPPALAGLPVPPATVTAHPDLTGLPGSNVLQQLINGAEAWSLAVALLGAFVGAGRWHRTPTTISSPRAGGWQH